MNISSRSALLGIFALALLVVPANASVNGKSYPGTLCQFGQADYVDKTKGFGKFVNESGATRKVVCTVMKDHINGDVEYASIAADSSMDESTCRFYERQQDGDLVAWSHDDTDSVASGITLTEWGDGTAWLDTGDDVSFAIACDLPDNDAIYVYTVDELF